MKFIDMHCDTFMALMEKDDSMRTSQTMINLEMLRDSDYLLQCFAMFVPYVNKKEKDYSPYKYCNQMMDRYDMEIKANQDLIRPVYRFKDIEENRKKHMVSSLLTIEEGGVLEGKMEALDHFYRRGARMICLSWNYNNEISSPNYDMLEIERTKKWATEPNMKKGLTPFGKAVVREMNRLGMIVDCSHMGDKGFFDCVAESSKPIVCSHSCVRNLCHSLRNLSDEMLFALKKNEGVVGINFCRSFLKDNEEDATWNEVVDHINYVKKLIGIEYVGIGSDFDGIGNEDIEMKNATYMPQLVNVMQSRGFSDKEIDQVTHENVLRVFEANLE